MAHFFLSLLNFDSSLMRNWRRWMAVCTCACKSLALRYMYETYWGII